MNIIFKDSPIEKASERYARVRITEDTQAPRLVVEGRVRTIEIGAGKWKQMNRRKFLVFVRKIVQLAQQHRETHIALKLDDSPFPLLNGIPLPELGQLIAENLEMANYQFTEYRTPPKKGWSEVKEVLVCDKTPSAMRAGFACGKLIGESVNACRDIANTPGGDMTPLKLAREAKRLAKGTKVSVSVFKKDALKKLKMGGILGVAKGANEDPALIVMKHQGGKAGEQPIVLIGKGVTFDTGGINIKPSEALLGMHYDMSGGAAVMAAVALAGKLKLKRTVIGIIPAVENSVSGESYRPGDILRSMSGKTIEVLNTDAEGRIILADAITYAERFKPSFVLTVATLTGAALVALGQRASALMTRDEKLAKELFELSEKSGDYLWRLPLWEEYEDEVHGTVGDVTNLSTKNARYGGAINGGVFLQQFAKKLRFAHLDIAPRMTTIPQDNLAPGASGEPVRLLIRVIKHG